MRASRTRARAHVRTTIMAALAVVAAAFVVPAAAHADPATVTGVVTNDDGGLDVHLADPGALWVQVNVLSAAGPDATVLASTDDLSYLDYRGWYTDTPLPLPAGAAYGDYPVDIAYRLADGTVQHWDSTPDGSTGDFAFRPRYSVASAQWDRTSTDVEHRTVTLSGTVSVFDPATDTSAPAGAGIGVTVTLTAGTGYDYRQLTQTATTDGTGAFSVPVVPGGGVDGYAAVTSVPSGSLPAAADYALTDVGFETTVVRMSGAPAHVRVHAGSTYSITGTVQQLTASAGWQPLADVTVDSYATATPSRLVASGTTDSAGHFVLRVTATRSMDLQTWVDSPYVTTGTQGDAFDTTVAVPTHGSFGTISFREDGYYDVTASGHLYGDCTEQRVALQYSRNGTSDWITIGSTTTPTFKSGSSCPVTVKGGGGTSGYYRLTHAESDQQLATTSARKRLARTPTRIVGFTLSTTHATVNGHLTTTGSVQQYVAGRWRGFRGFVYFLVRPTGDSTWYWDARGYASSTGHFSLTAKVYGSGSWLVSYRPDATHFYSESAARAVSAR